jgi:hypothetical protein
MLTLNGIVTTSTRDLWCVHPLGHLLMSNVKFHKFDDLDEDVQAGFNKYLRERGITNELATFITKYAEHKEQKVCSFSLSSLKLSLMIYLGASEMVRIRQEVHRRLSL